MGLAHELARDFVAKEKEKLRVKRENDLAELMEDVQRKKELRKKEEAERSRRKYRIPYSEFEWQSRHAQLIHLRSQWPTQQHIIMSRMFYEWFTHGSPSQMDHQRAKMILNTSTYVTAKVMLLMVKRGHLSRKRERYGKRRYCYVYTLTEQGKHYGRYIWEHQLDYKIEMMDQLREVACMSSRILHSSKEEYERNKLTIDYSVVNYDLKCQMELDEI